MIIPVDIPDDANSMMISGGLTDSGGFLICVKPEAIDKYRRETTADRIARYAQAIVDISNDYEEATAPRALSMRSKKETDENCFCNISEINCRKNEEDI